MPKYKVTGGKHWHLLDDGSQQVFTAGQEIVLSVEDAAKWPGKFELIYSSDEPETLKPEVVEPEPTAEPAAEPDLKQKGKK